MIAVSDLPELAKGKGNKMINIPPKRLKLGLEEMVDVIVAPPKTDVLVYSLSGDSK